ncbi:MAG TPA: DNA polymerase III subunit beta [Thermoanaerobaculia bacterium]|nr:DNA polymerase III subunit beta [Thermoanaerobaculia bacterium]
MDLRIDRAELLTELVPMQGVVERKSTVPVLSHLLLRARGDRLQLAATDLEVSLRSWCDAEVGADGAIAVQARKFVEIVRALDGEQVQLSLEGDQALQIRAGNSRFKIHGLSPEDFPTLPEVPQGAELLLPFADLKRMIAKVLFAVSAEESRFQLNGALLRAKDGAVEMVATDGHRLALVEMPQAAAESSDGVLVPRKALQEIQRFDSAEDLRFRRGEHHLSFQIGRRELICRILEGAFPDYEKVISKDSDKRTVFDRRRLMEVINRVALLSGERARVVRLKLDPAELTVSAVNPDLGEAVERLECEYDGPPLEIGLNPDYLAQFLGAVEGEQVRLDLKDANSQCIGHPVGAESGRYLCVIMPMRL